MLYLARQTDDAGHREDALKAASSEPGRSGINRLTPSAGLEDRVGETRGTRGYPLATVNRLRGGRLVMQRKSGEAKNGDRT